MGEDTPKSSFDKQVACSKPDGADIRNVREAVYLGGLITRDGRACKELSRRLGEGHRVFNDLEAVWRHASLPRQRRVQIYLACVESKVLYSLKSLWLLQADCQRLDTFHCKPLRRVMGIRHSYYSRVTTEEVLERAGCKPLSETLAVRQTTFYKKI